MERFQEMTTVLMGTDEARKQELLRTLVVQYPTFMQAIEAAAQRIV